jgi:3'(2'), 5'-bisphosphate nucleotidase
MGIEPVSPKELTFPPISGILPETKIAIEAALQAGKKVIEIYSTNFQTVEKSDQSPVTIADIESNRIIEQILSKSQIPILSEEGDNETKLNASKIWIVDPLDGTKEFVDKVGQFTIMISLVVNHSPVIGVILAPVQGLLYVAQRTNGAYRYSQGTWQKLHVSNISRIENARAVLSRSHVSNEELDFLKDLNISSYSRLGSSLKILALCSGESEVYFTASPKIKQWDTCASHCLITEAGGTMTDMLGNALEYNKGPLNHENGIVATNGPLHKLVIEKCPILMKK